jgi:hypothetical protein
MNTGRDSVRFDQRQGAHGGASVVRADPAPEVKMICCHEGERPRSAARQPWHDGW